MRDGQRVWEQMVIVLLARLVEESAPNFDLAPGNMMPGKDRMSARADAIGSMGYGARSGD